MRRLRAANAAPFHLELGVESFLFSALDQLDVIEADLAFSLIVSPGVQDHHVKLRVLFRLQPSHGIVIGRW